MEINRSVIAQIKNQISIVDLAKELGFSIESHGSRYLKIKEHDSCILYPITNTFKRYSTGAQGDIFDFLKEFSFKNFKEAYEFLIEKIDLDDPSQTQNFKKIKDIKSLKNRQERTLSLWKQLGNMNPTTEKVYNYLVNIRKINPEIVNEFLKKNLLKQVSTAHGDLLCFLGYDENALLACANYRSLNEKQFRGDMKDCDYNVGWIYEPDLDNSQLGNEPTLSKKPLVVTESSIDQLSLISIMMNDPENHADFRKLNYLSLGGVGKTNTVIKLQEKYGISKIILALDNDEAGRKAAQNLTKKLEGKCKIISIFSEAKDWNEDLQNQKIVEIKKNFHPKNDKKMNHKR